MFQITESEKQAAGTARDYVLAHYSLGVQYLDQPVADFMFLVISFSSRNRTRSTQLNNPYLYHHSMSAMAKLYAIIKNDERFSAMLGGYGFYRLAGLDSMQVFNNISFQSADWALNSRRAILLNLTRRPSDECALPFGKLLFAGFVESLRFTNQMLVKFPKHISRCSVCHCRYVGAKCTICTVATTSVEEVRNSIGNSKSIKLDKRKQSSTITESPPVLEPVREIRAPQARAERAVELEDYLQYAHFPSVNNVVENMRTTVQEELARRRQISPDPVDARTPNDVQERLMRMRQARAEMEEMNRRNNQRNNSDRSIANAVTESGLSFQQWIASQRNENGDNT